MEFREKDVPVAAIESFFCVKTTNKNRTIIFIVIIYGLFNSVWCVNGGTVLFETKLIFVMFCKLRVFVND